MKSIARLLCAIGLHRWEYEHDKEHGGKPVFRHCARCGKRQHWNYDAARTRGVIIWEDAE